MNMNESIQEDADDHAWVTIKPGEDVDVTFVVDEQLGDSRLTFARSNVQRRQPILHEVDIGAYCKVVKYVNLYSTYTLTNV